jgi:hypothetical protein
VYLHFWRKKKRLEETLHKQRERERERESEKEWTVEEKTPKRMLDVRWWGGGRLCCEREREGEIYEIGSFLWKLPI